MVGGDVRPPHSLVFFANPKIKTYVRSQNYRQLGPFILICLVFFATGCSSAFSDNVKSQATPAGLTGFASSRVAGVTILTTTSYIPGSETGKRSHLMARKHACNSKDISAIVLYGNEIAANDAIAACNTVLDTVKYVQRTIPKTHAVFKYELILVPTGFEFETTRRSISIHRPPTLRFAAPWLEDKKRSMANIVDVIAHESLHAHAFMAGLPEQDREEQAAYLMGLCAQLYVLGGFGIADLPGSPLADTDAAVTNSSNAAYEVRKNVYPYLTDGRLSFRSLMGGKLLNNCDRSIQELFDHKGHLE